MTFTEHTAVMMYKQGSVMVYESTDETVYAFDLLRY
jgi:hypothetical protein